MNIDGVPHRTIWRDEMGVVRVIDQRALPHRFEIVPLYSTNDCAIAIREMWVRGAPLIGATAAYGLALAMAEDPSDHNLQHKYDNLLDTRPTAINLRWALDRLKAALVPIPSPHRAETAFALAAQLCDEDVAMNAAIGEVGLKIIRTLWEQASAKPVNILTHCNAGWLGTVDWGTALAPIYKAHDAGVPIHVWVDETRPRNQGAALTARELSWHGVPHTVIADNTGGHLMQHGLVDLCIVGTDRVARNGDVCNKIGTYLKALAAHDNGVPFYVALPSPTIDWSIDDGIRDIPIEMRDPSEVTHIAGKTNNGDIVTVQLPPDGTAAANYGFDVTPARLISGLITERGVCLASEQGLSQLFPERILPLQSNR